MLTVRVLLCMSGLCMQSCSSQAEANTRQQDSVYSLNGIRRNTMQQGINIVDRKKIIH